MPLREVLESSWRRFALRRVGTGTGSEAPGPRRHKTGRHAGAGHARHLLSELESDLRRRKTTRVSKKKTESTGSATITYGGAYSGWEVVENAAIALTDGVDLLLTPGRLCQNGKPVPHDSRTFRSSPATCVQGRPGCSSKPRTPGNQEKVSDANNAVHDARPNCHEVHRDTGPADSPKRCSVPAKK